MQRRSTTAHRCAALHRSAAGVTEVDRVTVIHRAAAVDRAIDVDRATDVDAPDDTQFALGSAPAAAAPHAPDGPPIAAGTVVGNYRILGPLAQGGMGVVFLGRHLRLGRTVAIKFLHRRLLGDPDAAQRFFAEAVATARLAHPGVVSLFDYGDHDGHAYLVMEYLRGESLSARLASGGRLSFDRVIDIGIQLAQTLAAAHAAGIVHRDLKPDNIHLVPDPSGSGYEYVKVLDFGVAKLMPSPGDPAYTRRGDLLGTPYYMAPEQCLHAGAVDPRSDVYALGCVLFQLLTGAVPFNGTVLEVLMAHQTCLPPPPRRYLPEVPPALDHLIMRLLAKDPGRRPATMRQVAAELRSIDLGRRFAALPRRSRRPSRRHDQPSRRDQRATARARARPGDDAARPPAGAIALPARRRAITLLAATLVLAAVALAAGLGHIGGAWW